MATLEQIVRPYEAPQPFNSRRVIATAIRIPTETAHVSWGTTGTLPSAVESAPLGPAVAFSFNTKKEDQQLTEKARQTEKVKIQQEGNPDNFVVYERPKQITFGKTPGTTEPTYLTKPVGTGQTASPTPSPTVQGNGDIPVTKQGDTLFVDKRTLPGQGTVPGYLQIGDRVFTFSPPPPGPNESIVP